MEFDQRNLRKNEIVIMNIKPDKSSYMIRNFFFGAGIPFPVVVLWAIIDFGILFGVPISTQEYWLWSFLIPFMCIHGLPIWIWLLGILRGRQNYKSIGYMLTSMRFIMRADRKKPFDDYEIANIDSMTIIANRRNTITLHIKLHTIYKGITIMALKRKDAQDLIDRFHQIKHEMQNLELNSQYEPKCKNCGGVVLDGFCLYCGTQGTLRPKIKK